jgi:hypothetical protein
MQSHCNIDNMLSNVDKMQVSKGISICGYNFLIVYQLRCFDLCVRLVQTRLYAVTEKHLNALQKKFKEYFGNCVEDLDWVRDPFDDGGTSLPLKAQELLIDIKAVRTLRLKFHELFWGTFRFDNKARLPCNCQYGCQDAACILDHLFVRTGVVKAV